VTGPLVVVGDALLDVDVVGHAGRLSPDAPVPVLDDVVEHSRPGGAALAAALAARDGHQVVLVTALGEDEPGRRVEQLLGDVEVVRLPYDGPTTVKRRIRADGQSLVRLDTGTEPGTVGPPPGRVREVLEAAGSILVADYGRGAAAQPELRSLLAQLPARIPVVWDPHPRGAEPVPGVRLVTPNEAEAQTFSARLGRDVPAGATGLTAVSGRADNLVAAWQAQAVAVTLGERGALLSYGHGAPVVTPAPAVTCIDPCGAGDAFAVGAALSLGLGNVTTEAVQDAVASSAAFVAAGGAAAALGDTRTGRHDTTTTDAHGLAARVRAQGGVVVATGGCFDLLHAGHVATLRAARRLGDCLVVCLNSDHSVRRLKGESRPLVRAADRAKVLEALECVDAVLVFEEDTPVEVLRKLRPQVWAKGGDYAGADVPETAVLAEWGGQAVVLPYLRGHSTTDLVRVAAATGTDPRAD